MIITLATIRGPISVDATVTGEWAVHCDPFDTGIAGPHERWTVTHVPTGLRIPRQLTSKRARDLAERLSREVPTLGVPATIPTRQVQVNDLGPSRALRRYVRSAVCARRDAGAARCRRLSPISRNRTIRATSRRTRARWRCRCLQRSELLAVRRGDS